MADENMLLKKVTWLILAMISGSAIVLISYYSPYIPDYDGLMYFDIAKTINSWLFLPSDHKLKIDFTGTYVSFWPISNAISVFVAAIFYHTIEPNFLPALINSLYLFLFTWYVTKIRFISYAYIATLLLCSTLLFFRLFTTLTTEFAVGLWIFSFLLTLISTHEHRGKYLATLTILGLLLRTVDVVFILMAVSAYTVIHYALWKNRQHIFTTLRYVCFSLLLTSPLFFQHYKATFQYVYTASFGPSAASWKSLGGVSDRLDVPLQYANYLFSYNYLVVPITVLIIIFSFYSKAVTARSIALVTGTALSVCLPLLLASSLNIQVVFWIYACLIFIACELGAALFLTTGKKLYIFHLNGKVTSRITLSCIFLVCAFSLTMSWKYEVDNLKQLKDVSNIAVDISSVLNIEPGRPIISANYRGVGALDILGLSWRRATNFSDGGIEDIYSKNKNPREYLDLKSTTNFFITAHENYFFAPHFGINDHIAETHRLFSEKASEFGFRKAQEISRSGKEFDIWYRPGVQVQLQYASFGDQWISWKLPLEVGSQKLCNGDRVSGMLSLSVNFPDPSLPNYSPPFVITLHGKNTKDTISSTVVNQYGNANVELVLSSIACGKYELSFDKAFSTKADPRTLSAQFIKIESAFKFDIKQKDK